MRLLQARPASLVWWLSCLALRVSSQATSAEELEVIANNANNYYTDLHPCPVSCTDLVPSNWTVYNSFRRLERCAEPILFDFSIYNPVADLTSPTKLRVCTAGNADSKVNPLFSNDTATLSLSKRNDTTKASGCGASVAARETSKTLDLGVVAGTALDEQTQKAESNDLVKALETLQTYFGAGQTLCDETAMFSYSHGLVAGVYLGPSFGRATVSSLVNRLIAHVKSSPTTPGSTLTVQLCEKGRNANHVLGLVVSTGGNITAAQNAVRSWNEAKCLDLGSATPLRDISIWEDTSDLLPPLVTGGNDTSTNLTLHHDLSARQSTRPPCRTITVASGDSCASLAQRCGITSVMFTSFNGGNSICEYDPNKPCSGLQPGQTVCCSSGPKPDTKPQMGADGVCATHLIRSGDTCCSLATQNGLQMEDIERFNNGTTWGWYGCGRLLIDMYICLSAGKPPMPFPVSNAVCGPTKPGSTQPTGDKQLKDINPCPLKACCNVWGQCGINSEFCTEKPSASGNPGTSGLQNGCVSSCGMGIVNRDNGPRDGFGRIGYYETWNFHRDCLRMHVENSNTDGSYTIIHWAFAEINVADWTVKIVDEFNQWDKFKQMQNVKKVISFGGWGYSTEPATYDILRQATSPVNRAKFARNVNKFLVDEGLDGVDYDWEYPGVSTNYYEAKKKETDD